MRNKEWIPAFAGMTCEIVGMTGKEEEKEILRFAQKDWISFTNDNGIPAFAGMTNEIK